jgi:hypothetical protein
MNAVTIVEPGRHVEGRAGAGGMMLVVPPMLPSDTRVVAA